MKTYILLFFAFIYISSYAQVEISFGPETGINISGIPHFNSYEIEERGAVVKESSLPVISPKIGGFASFKPCKHFFISTGLNYKIVGRRDHDYRYEDNPYSQVTYTSNEYFHQTFHVISSTELMGYQFSIGKREFQIGAGFTFNYFVAGKHYENNIYDKENGEYVETEKSLNPFSLNDFELPAKRFNNQITLGLGCELTEKIDISLNVSAGQEIYYLEFRPDYWNSWCATSWGKIILTWIFQSLPDII